jgi:hypothetical protein
LVCIAGVDPVFNELSQLFSAQISLVPEQWYNTSTGSSDMDPQGVPYGFFHTPLPGEPDQNQPPVLSVLYVRLVASGFLCCETSLLRLVGWICSRVSIVQPLSSS